MYVTLCLTPHTTPCTTLDRILLIEEEYGIVGLGLSRKNHVRDPMLGNIIEEQIRVWK